LLEELLIFYNLSTPLKTHGGKRYLAKKIIDLFPPKCGNPNKPATNDTGYLHYVEPYAGGLSVLLANDPEGISEVANDLNKDLSNFWRVLQGKNGFYDLERLCDTTPFSQLEWDDSEVEMMVPIEVGGSTAVVRAWRFFVYCRQSLAGRMKGFSGITRTRTRRGMNNEVSAWLTVIEGLPEVHKRLQRVLVLNKPALTVITGQDGPRTLFYLDPPYLHETRTTTKDYGQYEMTREDHATLLDTLGGVEGRFLLSGYPSKLYQDYATRHNWQRRMFKLPNNAAGGNNKRIMTECVYANYDIEPCD